MRPEFEILEQWSVLTRRLSLIRIHCETVLAPMIEYTVHGVTSAVADLSYRSFHRQKLTVSTAGWSAEPPALSRIAPKA